MLQRVKDISLADIIRRHAWLKHDPEYRLKEMPESALTDAERIHLAEERRRDRRASARFWREWERQAPIGCRIDGFDYDHTWRKLTIFVPWIDKPSMTRTTRLADRGWPKATRVEVYNDEGLCALYRRRGDRWHAYWTDGGPEDTCKCCS